MTGTLSIRRALVVDDSMLIRHTVCSFLEQRGFEVDSAINGVDALGKLRLFQPHIIFTDLDMPKLNGHQFIDALKSSSKTREIPIVVLSARRSAQEPRADFCMKKDSDIQSELLRILAMTIEATMKTVLVSR